MGVNFALCSEDSERVELCLFDSVESTHESHRIPLPQRNYHIWHGYLPTRIFHWLLVLLVTISFVTGKLGGTAMQYHEWSGAAILVLVFFRVLWGFAGGMPSRFATFMRGPRKVFDYARSLLGKGHDPYLGHNPMGAWSIVASM